MAWKKLEFALNDSEQYDSAAQLSTYQSVQEKTKSQHTFQNKQ